MRGVAARIAANMETSLTVPTATGFKDIPAKLLEVNRKIVNGHLGRKRGGKVSFTHIIAYAITRAIADTVPAMNRSFAKDSNGKSLVVHNPHVNLGLAVDLPKPDGTRTLMVPAIHKADTLDFKEFVQRYNAQVKKVRQGTVTVEDFTGITVTVTNPGTLGTHKSVPRLMTGQGTIVGVGALNYPAEFEAADPDMLAEMGISKIVTISSTYDHRVIQGAESGLFLKQLHALLLGADDFYVNMFHDINIPYVSVKWLRDVNPVNREMATLEKQAKVNQIINQYRVRGHLIADINPLRLRETVSHPELDPASYGLTIWDLDRKFLTGSETGIYAVVGENKQMTLGALLSVLRDAYCRTVGVEYMHIQQPEEKRWIQQQIERPIPAVSSKQQRHILRRLNAAEALSSFLSTKYVGQKRFGIEGAEAVIPLIDTIMTCAADAEMSSVKMGMAHRGRVNVLVNVIGKTYQNLFREFDGAITEDQTQGAGDVKYHLGQHGVYTSPSGAQVNIELAANPSHLESVDPVVLGITRAHMDTIPHSTHHLPYPVLPLLIHGDAAFAGQGVVAETLNLSQIRGYRVGGTIHVIINNQLGFTTTPDAARSTDYSTDVAKMIGSPIFHVNGDDPEACVRVAKLAFDYRQKFHKDAVIDMICYRRHGHNEADDPSYTLPEMYRCIDAKTTVREQYTNTLVAKGELSIEEQEAVKRDYHTQMQSAFEEIRNSATKKDIKAKRPLKPIGVLPPVNTSINRTMVNRIYDTLSSTPEGFTVHPKLSQQFQARDTMFQNGEIDWALSESIAFGSLLLDGVSVRLSGQDSRRGTFSHRHSMLVDYHTSDEHMPLLGLCGQGTKIAIYDSLLSEYAVLGFEYGYALARPEALVIWEAQFGDFANGAQIVIDQFIVAAEDKWNQRCNIVLLLPHGMEGQGPEHSSARIERFMALAAEDNIQVCNPTTAAQYFHLLRRQTIRRERNPLIVFTPKSLLRSHSSRSHVEDITSGTFLEVLPDPINPEIVQPESVNRVIFCSGKVAYDAMRLRDKHNLPVAICRVEQLYPWPFHAVAHELQRYPNARDVLWLQEEPENMGAWNNVKGRLYEAHQHTHNIRRVSRPESGSPACGSARVHAQEQEELLHTAILS